MEVIGSTFAQEASRFARSGRRQPYVLRACRDHAVAFARRRSHRSTNPQAHWRLRRSCRRDAGLLFTGLPQPPSPTPRPFNFPYPTSWWPVPIRDGMAAPV